MFRKTFLLNNLNKTRQELLAASQSENTSSNVCPEMEISELDSEDLIDKIKSKQFNDTLNEKLNVKEMSEINTELYAEHSAGMNMSKDFDTTYSIFRSTFNREGDVIYGLSRPRAAYIKGALGESSALGEGVPTADSKNRWIVPLSEETSKSEMPSHVLKYHGFLKAHPKKKFNELANRESGRNSKDRKKKITRSCKALIEATASSGNTVHFLLDDGQHPWDMEAVVKKDRSKKAARIVSAKELRFIYKNRVKLGGAIQFWKDGEKVAAPWDDDPVLWSEKNFNSLKNSK